MKKIIKVGKRFPNEPNFKTTQVPDIDTTDDKLKKDVSAIVTKYSLGWKEQTQIYKNEIKLLTVYLIIQTIFWLMIIWGLLIIIYSL